MSITVEEVQKKFKLEHARHRRRMNDLLVEMEEAVKALCATKEEKPMAWQEWHGGNDKEMPVSYGVLVDIKNHSGKTVIGVPAGVKKSDADADYICWEKGIGGGKYPSFSCDITAWRLHRPTRQYLA